MLIPKHDAWISLTATQPIRYLARKRIRFHLLRISWRAAYPGI